MTFDLFAREWLETYPTASKPKRSAPGYSGIIERHLVPALGALELETIRV